MSLLLILSDLKTLYTYVTLSRKLNSIELLGRPENKGKSKNGQMHISRIFLCHGLDRIVPETLKLRASGIFDLPYHTVFRCTFLHFFYTRF